MPKNILLLILVVFLLFVIQSLSVSAGDNGCAKVFKSNCAECHDLDRGCGLLGQSQKEWVELFEFMEDMGADIPDDEKTLLLDCLDKPDDAIKEKCQS